MTTFSYQIQKEKYEVKKKHKENQNLFILFNKHTKKVVLQMRDRDETFVEWK